MKKRILCFLLSFVLLFALCPTYAFAADRVASITPSGASSPTVYFTSFNDCANALKDNSDYQDCTVKIHAYKNTDTTVLYVKGGTFTLNLNGFSLNNLTVESGTVTVTGDGAGGSNHNYIGKLYVKSGATVSINQGTYDYLENDGGTVTLTGGKYIQIESKLKKTAANAPGTERNLYVLSRAATSDILFFISTRAWSLARPSSIFSIFWAKFSFTAAKNAYNKSSTLAHTARMAKTPAVQNV